MQYRTSSMAEDVFYTFWFEKNLQGDIVAVYNSAGTKLVSYTYDAWGNCITTHHSVSGANSYATFNPFRYRGYYYDTELGFYFLNSRYYNPEWGRFINADVYVITGQGLLGYNMFAYCGNNPIVFIDPEGTEYRVVGADFQFDISFGCASAGLEIICYWDVEECSNGGVVIAGYIYNGASVPVNNPIVADIITTITDNLGSIREGSEDTLMMVGAMLSKEFSISVSGLLITGNEDFINTESYLGPFTSVNVKLGKVSGAYAYSDSCIAYALGYNFVGQPAKVSWGISYTTYQPLFEITVGQNNNVANSATNVNNCGGGYMRCPARGRLFAQCC